jgi:hypothetical protein
MPSLLTTGTGTVFFNAEALTSSRIKDVVLSPMTEKFIFLVLFFIS